MFISGDLRFLRAHTRHFNGYSYVFLYKHYFKGLEIDNLINPNILPIFLSLQTIIKIKFWFWDNMAAFTRTVNFCQSHIKLIGKLNNIYDIFMFGSLSCNTTINFKYWQTIFYCLIVNKKFSFRILIHLNIRTLVSSTPHQAFFFSSSAPKQL